LATKALKNAIESLRHQIYGSVLEKSALGPQTNDLIVSGRRATQQFGVAS
jgi:hypothetical protein